MANDSTIARYELTRDNEQAVLAENALAFERLVAWVRLVTLGLTSLGMRWLRHQTHVRPIRDPVRLGALVVYVAFALFVLVGTHRARFNARRAVRSEFFFAIVDFGFMTFMGLRAIQIEHLTSPQRGAIIFALLMCFSLGRMGRMHVVFSYLLACTCYVLTANVVGSELDADVFVLSCYGALALLLLKMQTRIRQMFVDLRKRDNLMTFLPRQVAERVMTLGDNALAPVQREVTVLFSDIRDFTALSETLNPAAVLAFLDEYFGHMAHLVKAHDGIVNKFLGDGMLAFWGVPERTPDHAELALKAALDMRKVVAELNGVRRERGLTALRIGIGIHTGIVAAGMLGGADQHEYTVIGDAVNVASRVEGLTKALGVDILVSESTWRLVGDRFKGERISEQRVKGRQEAVVVYSLEGRLPRQEDPGEASAA